MEMFVPPIYRAPDSSWMVELLRRNPLALMASRGPADGVPFATHLPVIVDPEMTGEWSDDLSGGLLLGHMNRQNPHWRSLQDGAQVLIVFTGPNSYVSPTVYEISPAAPTWDFTAVHVRGTVHRLDSFEQTLDVVQATVRALEGVAGTEWDMADSLGYFEQLAPEVGAFRVEVTGAEGMFKLSQEQPEEVRSRVQRAFVCQHAGRTRETGEMIDRIAAEGLVAGRS
jgi:transcriptional regulator